MPGLCRCGRVQETAQGANVFMHTLPGFKTTTPKAVTLNTIVMTRMGTWSRKVTCRLHRSSFLWLYLGSYKVIPKRNYHRAFG